MDQPVKIKEGVYWIGALDPGLVVFDIVIPTKHGTTYNAYLVRGEKIAVIETVKSYCVDGFISKIRSLVRPEDIDYIIINHTEPDHSGGLIRLMELAPKAIPVFSRGARTFVKNILHKEFDYKEVKAGDSIDLGGKVLKFISAPFLHWPETIMTYETSHRILFSCDAFGSYGAFHGAIFDDECEEFGFYQKEALRYYANIVASFSARVLSAIDKLKDVPVEVIAPSHGLIWRKNISLIVNLYKKWAEFAKGETEPEITLIYGSMYGNTEIMMNAVARGISRAGVSLEIFDAGRTHVSYILPSLWTKRGVMVGAPTYEVSLFPPVANVLSMAALKRIHNKKAAYFGSYGWSGGALRGLKNIIEPLKWNLMDTLEFTGCPTEKDLKCAEEFGEKFAQFVKEPE